MATLRRLRESLELEGRNEWFMQAFPALTGTTAFGYTREFYPGGSVRASAFISSFKRTSLRNLSCRQIVTLDPKTV